MIFVLNLHSEQIVNGDIYILKMKSNEAGELKVNGKKMPWFDTPNGDKFALISTNYHNKNDIIIKHTLGKSTTTTTLKAVLGDYKKEQLSVNKSKVNPPKSMQDRIKKEYTEANEIYAIRTPNLLFNSKFIYPLNSKITSNFGNARMFNNTLKSYHSGTDYRAAIGTKIPAVNDGVVKIAKDRYYAGGSVVIDHGAGIYSQYYHLSKINVKVGDKVAKGDIIGLSGDTGRVSGPHLHFGIVVNNNSINPMTFIEKINIALFGEN